MSKAKRNQGGHVARMPSGHRMVTNYAETASRYVRRDMDIPYKAHVRSMFGAVRYGEALTWATVSPWVAGSIPARRATLNSYVGLRVTHIHGHTWAQRLDHPGPLSTSGGPERGSEATCPFLDRFSGRPVQILPGLAGVNCLNSRWKRRLLFLTSDFRQTCRHRRFT